MQNQLPLRQIANTSLNISTLGFGAASMGNLYHAISDDDARATLNRAVQLGYNYFDTAPRYGLGLSERRVGDVLRKLNKSQYVISTKVGRVLKPDALAKLDSLRYGFASPMPFDAHYDYTYDGIMRSFEDSLMRLGLAEIDILLVHDIGKLTHGDLDKVYFSQLRTSGYRALEELKANGYIKAIGLGVNEYEVCERAMDIGQFDCFLLAGRYSLLEQAPLAEFFPKCMEYGASIILGGPYNSGILATGVKGENIGYYNYKPAPRAIVQRVSEIEKVCERYQVSLPAAALQFPLGHPCIASVIPGLSSVRFVEQTRELFSQSIPQEFWQTLKNLQLIDEQAPVPKS